MRMISKTEDVQCRVVQRIEHSSEKASLLTQNQGMFSIESYGNTCMTEMYTQRQDLPVKLHHAARCTQSTTRGISIAL